jgi:hypothetical protein
MIRIASPLIVWHTYTQDQENITTSTTRVFNDFICHFFSISLHKGLQLTLSPFFEQTYLELVTWTISTHMSSPQWLQVTSTNDLIINKIWFLIAWLVPRLNISTFFFTLAMVPRSSSHRLPSPPLSPSKFLPCYLHLIKPYSSHIILNIHWKTIS